MKTEFLFFWLTVVFYGLSAFSYIVSLIFKKEKLLLSGIILAFLGFLPHTLVVALRWIEAGAPPFIDISESIISAVLVGIFLFLIGQFLVKKIKAIGVLVMPVSFILMGWAGTLVKAKEMGRALPPALQSYWLWVHIISASIGYGAALVAAGLGLLFLLKEKYKSGFYEKIPDLNILDNLSYRFVTSGFIMLGVMIVSGAFWADQVQGKYWNWDPVEVWSLISWLIYGIYLHLRITMGWRGKRLAWYVLIALPVMIISLWGIPFIAETFHRGFRIEH